MSNELFSAIRAGDADSVRKVAMAEPQLLKQPNKRGELPLLVAAESGDAALVEALLDAGVDPDCRSDASDGQTALLSAVWGADDVMLQTLLKGGADPTAADKRKRNAAHACALIGNRVLLDFLCNPAGFDPDTFGKAPKLQLSAVAAQDTDGMTPLHYACAEVAAAAHVASVLEYFLKEAPEKHLRAAAAKRSSSGRLPLHCLAGAVTAGQESPRILELLKRLVEVSGADGVAAEEEEEMTPLHIAAVGGAPKVFAALAAAAEPEVLERVASSDGRTVLHAACTHDSTTVVTEILVAVPPTVRARLWGVKDKSGKTCAAIAAAAGSLEALAGAGAPAELLKQARDGAASSPAAKAVDKLGKPTPAASDSPASKSKATAAKKDTGDFSGAGHVAEQAPGESRTAMVVLAFAVFVTVTLPLLHTM
eukprot:CAMPEP_0174846306 /NCGR_PEP_ID=MMETSP1114-20130205/12233_1 /TAXON_ID=312471 /ORGANISM="Neobodo designis, Strain CCAP 1951/1" /LENGTH=422 /DNA_ID=CAMNT_0016080569 /DNA_START=32 /DNA_END=1297 /DNA_ORIENTATION=-